MGRESSEKWQLNPVSNAPNLSVMSFLIIFKVPYLFDVNANSLASVALENKGFASSFLILTLMIHIFSCQFPPIPREININKHLQFIKKIWCKIQTTL